MILVFLRVMQSSDHVPLKTREVTPVLFLWKRGFVTHWLYLNYCDFSAYWILNKILFLLFYWLGFFFVFFFKPIDRLFQSINYLNNYTKHWKSSEFYKTSDNVVLHDTTKFKCHFSIPFMKHFNHTRNNCAKLNSATPTQ